MGKTAVRAQPAEKNARRLFPHGLSLAEGSCERSISFSGSAPDFQAVPREGELRFRGDYCELLIALLGKAGWLLTRPTENRDPLGLRYTPHSLTWTVVLYAQIDSFWVVPQ
jgi:hypothetical protein